MTAATAVDRFAEAYHRDGVAVVRGLLDAGQAAEARDRVLALLDGPRELQVQWEPGLEARVDLPRRRRARVLFHCCHSDPWFMAHALRPEIVDAVERLIGPDIALYTDQVFLKGGEGGSEVAFHQDAAYWPFDPPEAVTCWLALDRATVANGCVRFVPGSHRERLAHAASDGPQPLGLDASWSARAVPVELEPGDASFHHSLVVHGSAANRSGERRMGMALIYLPTGCRVAGRDGWFRHGFVRARGRRHREGVPTP